MGRKQKNRNGELQDQNSDENAHRILLRLKNRKKAKNVNADDVRNKYSLKNSILSLVGITVHWLLMIVIAMVNFSKGAVYFSVLVLFFQFVGGIFVTVYLHFLTSRKGDAEFKAELRKHSRVLLYLMCIPSFLPFFSAGLSIHLSKKLRKTKNESEVKQLVDLLKICEERLVIEQLYESSFSSFPLGVTQLVIMLEITSFKPTDIALLLGFLSVWKETAAAPMRLARIVNGHNARFVETAAGLGNKCVTLLSFAFWITASRRHYADLTVVDHHLVLSTVIPAVVVLLVADSPGVYAFTLEMRRLLKRRVTLGWEYLLDLITFCVPLLGITFWTWVIVFEKDLLFEVVYILPACVFAIGFGLSLCGFCFEKNLPWLGQFSSDILLLGYIAIESYFRGYEFHDIDFTYEPHPKKEIQNGGGTDEQIEMPNEGDTHELHPNKEIQNEGETV